MEGAEAAVKLVFLGVGDASQQQLGHASAVVELAAQRLLIDCGPGVLKSYLDRYGRLPEALFITHCHLDHVADFEKLFIKSWFAEGARPRPKIFVPVGIVEQLHQRVASFPQPLAEGGVNFWDAFQLIPVSREFEYAGKRFHVPEVRHHRPGSAYGLYLPECFFYTGDTRPIPEVIKSLDEVTTIFHDCSVIGNPSHSGIDDLLREYDATLRERVYCYHYNSRSDVDAFKRKQLKVVEAGQEFVFPIQAA